MIFAFMAGDEPLYVFGLSHENLDRLRAGQPITFSMRERGADVDGRVVICAGPTEEAIALEWSELVGKHTKVIDKRG